MTTKKVDAEQAARYYDVAVIDAEIADLRVVRRKLIREIKAAEDARTGEFRSQAADLLRRTRLAEAETNQRWAEIDARQAVTEPLHI